MRWRRQTDRMLPWGPVFGGQLRPREGTHARDQRPANDTCAPGAADRAGAVVPGTNGEIAFTTNRDGDYEIFAMNADGTGQTRLTKNTADDTRPAWSPDGTKVAFTSNRNGN